jgi:hypothetical protein
MLVAVCRGSDSRAGSHSQDSFLIRMWDPQPGDGYPNAFGDRMGAFEIGVGPHKHHLLPTVASRGVGFAQAVVPDPRYVSEDDVPFPTAIRVQAIGRNWR